MQVDLTQPARLPQRIALSGSFVGLEPLSSANHGEALWSGLGGESNAALWRYMHDGPFTDRGAFDENMRARESSTDPLFYAVVDPVRRVALGRTALMRIDAGNRVIEVGNIIYSRALKRTRAATEAMYLLARYVFEELGYRRYEWKCNAENAESKSAALRLGFTFEGIFRQHMIVKARNRDTAWFSMLDSEWPARRQEFERWLDRSNFDSAGLQKSTLNHRI
jgi:RimJ/RimL family protein N-acetyltransferase